MLGKSPGGMTVSVAPLSAANLISSPLFVLLDCFHTLWFDCNANVGVFPPVLNRLCLEVLFALLLADIGSTSRSERLRQASKELWTLHAYDSWL